MGAYEPLFATLLLFAGLGAAGLYFNSIKNKKYAKEMEEYEKALAAIRLNAGAPPKAAAPQAASAQAVPQGSVILKGVDDKTAAMIMAIVCDAAGGDPAELSFVSITAK